MAFIIKGDDFIESISNCFEKIKLQKALIGIGSSNFPWSGYLSKLWVDRGLSWSFYTLCRIKK